MAEKIKRPILNGEELLEWFLLGSAVSCTLFTGLMTFYQVLLKVVSK